MKIRAILVPCLIAWLLPLEVWADDSPGWDTVLADAGRVRIDLAVAYVNVDRRQYAAGEPLILQVGSGAFVAVPTLAGERIDSADTLVGSLGLRYGIGSSSELQLRGSALSTHWRVGDPAGMAAGSESRFVDAWLGFSHQFSEDRVWPALLGFAEVALHERHQERRARFKSTIAGVTLYRAVDPVVLSVSMGGRLGRSRSVGVAEYRPGPLMFVNPSVGFAVNDQVTLITGVQWTRRGPDRYDGWAAGISRSTTDILLGLGYSLASGTLMNFSVKTTAAGPQAAELRFGVIHSL
jgi:hypothetical protein